MDRVSKETRSRIMRAVKSRGTKPELAVEAALDAIRVIHRKRDDLPGRPDLVVGDLAVFIHGCFWHCCPTHFRMPKSRLAFWRAKFKANRARDARVRRRLNRLGWAYMMIWEHSVAADPAAVAIRIRARARRATKKGIRITYPKT